MEKQTNTEAEEIAVGHCIVGETYMPPRIDIIEIKIEKGFADSTADFGEETW